VDVENLIISWNDIWCQKIKDADINVDLVIHFSKISHKILKEFSVFSLTLKGVIKIAQIYLHFDFIGKWTKGLFKM
jgi:hypothetical protein